MFEVLIVVGLVIAIFVAAALPWPSLFVAGLVTTSAGLVFGVATGFTYHVALARALIASNTLPRRWWLRPVPLHERLDAIARRRVMPWFYAGAVGFVVTVAGLALMAFSVAVAMWRTS